MGNDPNECLRSCQPNCEVGQQNEMWVPNSDDPNGFCRAFKNLTYPVLIFYSPSGKADVPPGDA